MLRLRNRSGPATPATPLLRHTHRFRALGVLGSESYLRSGASAFCQTGLCERPRATLKMIRSRRLCKRTGSCGDGSITNAVDHLGHKDRTLFSMAKFFSHASEPTTSFASRRVNSSTFLIVEDDAYGEQPHIYVKVYKSHLLITDTGCNRPRDKSRSLVSLRKYLEEFPLAINNNESLNPKGKLKYTIICTHCHYDHILGITQFLNTEPTIIASTYDKAFLLQNLPTHSLCKYMNVATPQYEISKWARHLSFLTLPVPGPVPVPDTNFRAQFLHIPGHTPDSLAWYDLDENTLYVGDTFYERKWSNPDTISDLPEDFTQLGDLSEASKGVVIFPNEGGDWISYMASLAMLLSFVQFRNAELKRRGKVDDKPVERVTVCCGHLTFNADAESKILEVQSLFRRIIAGEVPVVGSGLKRGVITDFWLEGKEAKYSVVAPRRLAEEARSHFRV